MRRKRTDPMRRNIARRLRRVSGNVVGKGDAAGAVEAQIGEKIVDPAGGIGIHLAVEFELACHF
jgi:hypothetical protein